MNHRSPAATVAALATLALGLAAVGGCTSTSKTTKNSACATTKVVQAEPRSQTPSPTRALGPSLVAGDALAFQTRLAGGYDVLPAEDGRRYAAVLLIR